MKHRPLFDAVPLALLVEPETPNEARTASLLAWAATARSWIFDNLRRHAAMLLRGFEVQGTADFEAVCRALAPRLKAYVGGESPRTAVSGGVYTSTEYPAHLEIALHSEMSYAHAWPSHLFFFCMQPAETGGETPIADNRRILAGIDPDVASRFEARQVMYQNNYHDGWGLGKSWQETFETGDRSAVERYLDDAGMTYRWSEKGLWTRVVRPATVCHPDTGERVWFNQADRWHVSARGEDAARKLLRIMDEDELPRHARYGDGGPIAAADLDAVRLAYAGAEQLFTWRRGDVLLLDNLLAAHGRKPFTGQRRVHVAMA